MAPNNTIMVRGLAQHISENDIRQDILGLGLVAKDIRLIRKKETGKSLLSNSPAFIIFFHTTRSFRNVSLPLLLLPLPLPLPLHARLPFRFWLTSSR